MKKANCKKALSTEVNEDILGPYQGSHSDETNRNFGQTRAGIGNFEQTGKVRENYTKYWKTGNFIQMLFVILVIFK